MYLGSSIIGQKLNVTTNVTLKKYRKVYNE